MNCKPGDLAVIVRVSLERHKNLIGKVIQVTKPYFSEVGQCMAWRYEGSDLVGATGIPIYGVYDWELSPIRDPGDDAVDEVIQRIGTPHKEVA